VWSPLAFAEKLNHGHVAGGIALVVEKISLREVGRWSSP
jgi:hypothetical protein